VPIQIARPPSRRAPAGTGQLARQRPRRAVLGRTRMVAGRNAVLEAMKRRFPSRPRTWQRAPSATTASVTFSSSLRADERCCSRSPGVSWTGRRARRTHCRTPVGRHDRGRLEDLCRRGCPHSDRAGYEPQPQPARLRRCLTAMQPSASPTCRSVRPACSRGRERGARSVAISPRGMRLSRLNTDQQECRIPQRWCGDGIALYEVSRQRV